MILPLVSAPTVKELARVLAYPKFRLSAADREELLADYLPYAEVVRTEGIVPERSPLPRCRDPLDDMFLELAQAGHADALVTGDKDLLVSKDPGEQRTGFLILTPTEALQHWGH